MATIVDARGKACPQPVIDTKNAIKEQGTPVITMVDNDIARQNVEKMARQMGLNAESSEIDGGWRDSHSAGQHRCPVSSHERCRRCAGWHAARP